jgi:hypothetical protein
MSTFSVRAIGFCAHYSPPGDWAFDFALRLARAGSLQLNVFHFLVDPYDPAARAPHRLGSDERAALAVRLERDLRLYYDARLGDYLEAGFRLCEDPEWTELHRCLTKREFQVLVLGYPHEAASFGGLPIEEFVSRFVSPVVLVGPSSPLEIRLNAPAALVRDKLGLSDRHYIPVRPPSGVEGAPRVGTLAGLELE